MVIFECLYLGWHTCLILEFLKEGVKNIIIVLTFGETKNFKRNAIFSLSSIKLASKKNTKYCCKLIKRATGPKHLLLGIMK